MNAYSEKEMDNWLERTELLLGDEKLGLLKRAHVLVVGDSLSSDIQGGANAGLDTCWLNRSHSENPGQVSPTYEIDALEQLYPIVMEQDELARVGMRNRRHQL